MITWLLMMIVVPLFLWSLGVLVDALVERRYRAARERDRAIAEAILREWTRLGEAVDLDPEEAVRAAEEIVKWTR